MDPHLHLFFQVYSNSLQEKLVQIMQNMSLSVLWIGGWYSNIPIPSMGDTYRAIDLRVCLTIYNTYLCTTMHC